MIILFHHALLQILGNVVFDASHQRSKITEHVLKRLGLTWIYSEVCALVNVMGGPFRQNKNWDACVECMLAFFAHHGYLDDLYQQYYDRISRDLSGGTLPARHGTVAHMMELFQELEEINEIFFVCSGQVDIGYNINRERKPR